jgi:hypothetical protein
MKGELRNVGGDAVPTLVAERAAEFFKQFETQEARMGLPHLLYIDNLLGAHYILAHLEADALIEGSDLEAVLAPDESDEYKLNRDIYTDNYAYQVMKDDACKGRTFEDIVVEFDSSYRPDRPLKIFGGQHRISAVSEAAKTGKKQAHGLRVYFGLNENQRLDIAKANNTAIVVASDLLDRMQEEFLGGELRTWCQAIGLLPKGENFADRRSSGGIPTVRIARTFITNFYAARGKKFDDFLQPVVCTSGPHVDDYYAATRPKVDWTDPVLTEAGKRFAELHSIQRKQVLQRETDSYSEYANKALHPCVVAAWAFSAGLLQEAPDALKRHYELPKSVSGQKDSDPLGASDLSAARLKGVDPDTYRGLGARISASELGRMLEVFLLQATKATKPGINLKLANAAIQSYEAKKQSQAANKAIRGI